MSNYAAFSSGEELYEAAIRGVKPGWFDEELLLTIHERLCYLYDCACREEGMNRKGEPVQYCPSPVNIFRPLKVISPEEVKVVILGQDPYPRIDDAIGIAFHAGEEGKYTVSAGNIRKCLERFEHIPVPTPAPGKRVAKKTYNFLNWLEQGVLLINTVFTTIEGTSGAHIIAWNGIIEQLLRRVPSESVALLLGRPAQEKAAAIPSDVKVTHCHPAERKGTFHRTDIFGEVNTALAEIGRDPIDWSLA